jgi:hypothetical protein
MKKFCFYWNSFKLFKKFLNRKAIATAFLIATLPVMANAQTPTLAEVDGTALNLSSYPGTSPSTPESFNIRVTSNGLNTTFGAAGHSTYSVGQSFTIGGWDSSVNLGGGGRCR